MSAACVHLGIGEEHYALAVEHVLEVAELRDLTAVPGAPQSVLGVINHDGQVLAVVDLARAIGAPSAGHPARLLVVDDGRRRAALAVDVILDVRPAPELTEATESDVLSGAALVEGSLVGMLAISSVLDAAAYPHGTGDGNGR